MFSIFSGKCHMLANLHDALTKLQNFFCVLKCFSKMSSYIENILNVQKLVIVA